MRVPSLGEPTPRGRGMGTGRMEADADMARSVKYLYYTGREGGGISVRDVGAAAGREVQVIRCTTICNIWAFAGYAAAGCGVGRRAGSLETCGFKQTFWSLLGLRPKVTRARGRGTFPAGGMQGKSRQVAAGKSDPRSEARNILFGKRIAGRRGRRPLQCAGTEPRRNERGRGRTSVRQTFPAII